ncbi:hypothetical protein [Radicibacter daui]|uniref:hypothetical protein n=1 Tax=Radicibacter daui TaxID=3064829 RepID=UPI004046C1FC
MSTDALLESEYAIKMIKASRQKPMNFAFAFSGPLENALVADKIRTGPQLFALLKKKKYTKGFWGELSFEGSSIEFTVNKEITGQQKLLTEWLREHGLPLKVAVAPAGDGADMEPDTATDLPKAREEEAEEEDDGEEEPGQKIFRPQTIKKNILRARNEPFHFAYGAGADGADDLLALHKRAAGRKLAALIKQNNGAVKGAFGTVTLDGKIATFQCERRPPAGLPRRLMKLFKGWKLPFRPVVLGPDGVIEPDGDLEERQSEGSDAVSERLAEFKRKRDDYIGPLQSIIKTRPETEKEIRDLYRELDSALSASNSDAAARALERVEAMIGSTGPEEREDGISLGSSRLRADVDRSLQSFQKAFSAVSPDTGKLIEEIRKYCWNTYEKMTESLGAAIESGQRADAVFLAGEWKDMIFADEKYRRLKIAGEEFNIVSPGVLFVDFLQTELLTGSG